MADAQQVYWIGSNNHVYTKGPSFDGVQDVGTAGSTTASGQAVLHPNGSQSYVQKAQFIADPNAPAPADASTTTSTNSYGGYGTLADQQAAENAKLQIQQGLDSANSGISRLGTQESIGKGNIDKQYQSAVDQILGNEAIANRDYQSNRTGQINDYEGARANDANNARSWLEAAQRTLGAQGAGGGSAARYGLPYEAQTQATQANAGAQATNNKNLIALDTGHTDDENKFTNAKNNAAQQRDQGVNDLEGKIATQRATLLNTIAQLTGQMNIANGGNYQSALGASQGYTSQIPAILNQIDQLSATPAITPLAVTTSKPTLDAYNYARPDAPVVAHQDPTLTSSPVIAGILGNQQDQKDQQQQPVLQPVPAQ